MGQYFRIVNLDKKEWIQPDGWKLWELCANNSIRILGYLCATNNWDGTGIAKHFMSKEEMDQLIQKYRALGYEVKVHLLVHEDNEYRGYVVPRLKYFGRWCGDRIVVLGDYADSSTNYKPGETGPSYDDLENNQEYKNITEEAVREFNMFIEEEEFMIKLR